jgi:3-dehydroquinate synthase
MKASGLPTHVIITNQMNNDLLRVISKKNYSKLVVLVDSNTRKACYPKLNSELPAHDIIEIEAGEEQKNLATCEKVWQQLTDLNADRKALLIVLGGGVPGDLGGFCAATYKRGIDFILIPTTLLSQVDASVGGKLGIDFHGFKNHIGVFQEPVATIIDPRFLETLSTAELRSGFAEVIKHCLLSDKAMWDIIRKKKLGELDWTVMVPHSVSFKAKVTQADPKESGLRKILNFGHTIGHALESYFLNTPNRLLHGEAIAIGMIAESWIALQRNLLTQDELLQIQAYIISLYGKVNLPLDKTSVVSLALQDKKNVGDKILIAVPKGVGNHVWDLETSEAEIIEALNFYEGLTT